MTSRNNERIMQRRQELIAQQRAERSAFDKFGKNLEAEQLARLETANTVWDLVQVSGQARAGDILGLTKAEVVAYCKEAADAVVTKVDEANAAKADSTAPDTGETSGETTVPKQSPGVESVGASV